MNRLQRGERSAVNRSSPAPRPHSCVRLSSRDDGAVRCPSDELEGGVTTVLSPSPAASAEQAALEVIRSFFRDKPLVFIGTGMSCALDVRFGMPALRDELLRSVVPAESAAAEVVQWDAVQQALVAGEGLESALNRVSDPGLLQRITVATAKFIASLDQDYAFAIAEGRRTWPAIGLIKRLVATLPEGDAVLHVVTPNYDLLLEHACDYEHVLYTTGFCGGVERTCDWAALDHCLVTRDKVMLRGRLSATYKQRKHIRIHKVHGSLDFFFHRGSVVQNHAWMWSPPGFAQRVIVTPGVSKYETLQAFRQELLRAADAAIERASEFLFLGYGFNDGHLEEYISRKLVGQRCRGLIITRDANARIEALLARSPKLWLICRGFDAVAEGTRISNPASGTDLFVPGRRLWDIAAFTTEVLGV